MRCIALLNRRRRAVSCSFMSVQGYFKALGVHTFHSEGRRCTKTPISENKTQSNKYVARARAQKMNKYHTMSPIYFFIFKQSACRTGWWTDFFLSTARCYVINYHIKLRRWLTFLTVADELLFTSRGPGESRLKVVATIRCPYHWPSKKLHQLKRGHGAARPWPNPTWPRAAQSKQGEVAGERLRLAVDREGGSRLCKWDWPSTEGSRRSRSAPVTGAES